MKISLLFLGSTGAGPVYSLEFAKAILKRNDCDLQVVISKEVENIDSWRKEIGVNIDNFHVIDTYKHSSLHLALSFLQFWKINKLVSILKEYKPDIVFVPFGLIWAPVVFYKISKFSKVINVIHDPHPHDKIYNPLICILNFFCYISIKNNSSGIVVLNKKDVDYVKCKYNKNVTVIPHAVFDYYTEDKSFIPKNIISKKIGFIGRIEPYKGLDLLINAFLRNKDLKLNLIIAGSGKIDDEIKNKIQSDSRIILINRYIREEEFEELFNQIDILVLPYKRASQSGVIPMSFAFGVPVIATNVGALSEQVPEGTGLVIPVDEDVILKSINDLYNEPSLILSMGKKAKSYADNNMTWDKSVELLLKFLYSLQL